MAQLFKTSKALVSQAVENVDFSGNEHAGKVVVINGRNYIIEKLIASGGFAQVFLVKAANTSQQFFALKKVFTQDRDTMKAIVQEIDLMKNLSTSDKCVRFIDATTQNEPNGTSFYILMEYCAGGQLVDYLNGRINSRPNDKEVLRIFSDICESVAFLHYQKPPVIHRDLKIENVLLTSRGEIKLTDFGSATRDAVRITNIKEVPQYELHIQKYTTLAFRAPEMVDLYQKKLINEKADIWALGCLLYNICYYVSPFETTGQLAILNAKYDIPDHPPYSPEIKNLIGYLLTPDPDRRPNIYQVLERVCKLRGLPCPIQNIYPDNPQPSQPEAPRAHPPPHHPEPEIRVQKPEFQPQSDIVPMRRGRARNQGDATSPQPNMPASPMHPTRPAAQAQAQAQAHSQAPVAKPSASSFDDAFGGSALKPSQSSPSSFDDAFGASLNVSPKPSSSSAFDDAFGAPLPNTNAGPSSAFDDAFGGPSSAFTPSFPPIKTAMLVDVSHPEQPQTPEDGQSPGNSGFGSRKSSSTDIASPFAQSVARRLSGVHLSSPVGERRPTPTSWVNEFALQKAYSESTIKKILEELWKQVDEEAPASWLIPESIKGSPESAGNLASLYILHRVMLEGPPKALKELSSKVSYFETVKQNSTAQLNRDKVVAKRTMLYADYLQKKLAFHAKYPEFEGTYSLELFFHQFQKLPPQQRKMTFFNPEFVRELMDHFTQMDEVREVMCSSTILSPDNISFLVVVALLQESFAIYTLLLHILSKMKETQQFTQEFFGLSGRASRTQTSLQSYVEVAGKYLQASPFPIPAFPVLAPSTLDKPPYPFPASSGPVFLARLFRHGFDASKLSVHEAFKAKIAALEPGPDSDNE